IENLLTSSLPPASTEPHQASSDVSTSSSSPTQFKLEPLNLVSIPELHSERQAKNASKTVHPPSPTSVHSTENSRPSKEPFEDISDAEQEDEENEDDTSSLGIGQMDADDSNSKCSKDDSL